MMDSLAPGAVLKQVAEALPAACREQVIIIGSLAAASLLWDGHRQRASHKGR